MSDQISAIPPRELEPGFWWLPQCVPTGPVFDGVRAHLHASQFLIVGSDATLLYDVGFPSLNSDLHAGLDQALGDRPLDWVIPSHPELPHSGDLEALFERYPNLRVGGDVRDYHLYLPEYADRFHELPIGHVIDLGDGYSFKVMPAVIRDIPNTVWGYEARTQTLFTADGIAYTHHPPPDDPDDEDDDTFHLPGECLLTSTELDVEPTLDQATFVTRTALYWTRFLSSEPYFEELEQILATHPIRMMAPTHGNIVTNPASVLPVIREAHRLALVEGKSARAANPFAKPTAT
ncbi:MBL fold metallo-hydrolase [Sinosporangium album]|nr:MBL fold metallo-hydrolase [Sinosporangium album]